MSHPLDPSLGTYSLFALTSLALQAPLTTNTSPDYSPASHDPIVETDNAPTPLLPNNARVNDRNVLRLRPIDITVQSRMIELDTAFPPDNTSARLTAHMFDLLRGAGLSEDLHSVTPEDVLAYLVARDATSNTIVHRSDCPAWHKPLHCECPKRTKYDSLKTTVGRLRGVFRDAGMPLPWENRKPPSKPRKLRPRAA